MSVLMTYAPASAPRAVAIAERLEALGFAVSAAPAPSALAPLQRRKLAAAMAKAKTVIVLWSREAPLALRALARQALRAGKLVLARLDAARPPFQGAALDFSRSDNPRALTALASVLTGSRHMTEAVPVSRSMRLEGLGVALVFSLVVATAAYFVDAAFAARVNSAAHEVQTGAMALIGKIKS